MGGPRKTCLTSPEQSQSHTEVLSAASAAARAELWRRGDLTYLLHPGQLEIWQAIEANPEASQWVLEIARKWGKTFFLVAICAMLCRRYPKVRIPYGAPTLKHLEEFVLPVLDEVAADAPADIRPVYRPTEGHWWFPETESWVHLFGADDKTKARRGRGPKALISVFDECGFTPVLNLVLRDVFRPSMFYKRQPGRPRFTLLGSTPPDEAGHEFGRICEIAEANGHHFRRTVHDNPMVSKEDIREFAEENARDNGMTLDEYFQSHEWRREYLAERVADRRLAAVPEWGESFKDGESPIFRSVKRPKFFDAYVAQDPGGIDPHFVGFGYFHFGLNALVVEDELVFRDGQNTEEKAKAIKAKEIELWGEASHDGTLRGAREEGVKLPPWLMLESALSPTAQPLLRVSDVDVDLINDLHQLHGLAFIPTEKVDKAIHVNNLRVGMKRGQVIINPKCRNLDRHLKTTLWKNERRSEFLRKNGEHGDGVDMLTYMFRNILWGRNPEPPNWDKDPAKHFVQPADPVPDNLRGLAEAFTFE